MLPVVKDFVKKFDLKDFVVVTDSGLMTKDNIAELEQNGYKYIVGARIKNENKAVTKWILSQNKQDGSFYEYLYCVRLRSAKHERSTRYQKSEQCKLILGYCEQRAKKDAYNREKGIKRLEKEYKNGTVTKDKINKRGYNNFLELLVLCTKYAVSDNVEVKINYTQIKEDEKWDGLKGYITNTDLSANNVYEQYLIPFFTDFPLYMTKI